MERKYTKGEWVNSGRRIGTIIDDDTQANGMMLVIAHIDEYDHPEHEANSRLIAAAPELLEACRKALYLIKGREHDGFLREAIAKALGETE